MRKLLFVVTLFLAALITCSSLADNVLSEYSTEFAFRGKSSSARAENIKLAAQLLNGTVIQPGEVFSFNEVVGPRNEKAGFKKAKVIHKRRLRKDYGGGVCQVASTMHAAFLYAGFEIVEHTPHSRASTYIYPSLDATVVWPQTDLKVRNTHGFPIRITASVETPDMETGKPPAPAKLHVALHGFGEVKRSLIDFQVVETEEFITWRIARADWPVGKTKVQEPGTLGYRLYRIRTVYDPIAGPRQERKLFVYPPSRKILIVGTKPAKTVSLVCPSC